MIHEVGIVHVVAMLIFIFWSYLFMNMALALLPPCKFMQPPCQYVFLQVAVRELQTEMRQQFCSFVLLKCRVAVFPPPPPTEIPLSQRGFSVVSVSQHKIVLVGFKATDPLPGFTFCMLLSISS
jgi:hypothetical protein